MSKINFLKHAKRLPALDWNLTFFGAHEQTVTSEWCVPLEKHYAFECIYVIAGVELVKIGDADYSLKAGDFFFIPPEFPHVIQAIGGLTYFCFHFDLDDPNLKAQLIQGIEYYYPKESPMCQQLSGSLIALDELIGEQAYDFNTKMVIQIELSKILHVLYTYSKTAINLHLSTNNEYSRMIADYLNTHLTNQVLNYIKNIYVPDLSSIKVEDAIASVGLSDGYGFRIFKATYGISPRNYLTRLKLNEAKKLLLNPTYSIENIGVALGYSNLSNFSRQFKRWTGSSPIQYRKKDHM